ncbi:Phosphoribosylamine--glycine ligase [Kutzneria sp. CA-103260]|nr:Phosphoribosylamine--glycine ligase [Kutzneria sp. CA-103260]
MRVLIIGSGAREHALVLAFLKDLSVTAVACAPGNAGTSAVCETYGIDLTDPTAVAALAKEWNAGLVVIGSELPLVAGAADPVRDAGIPCFGPSREAARIEGSKAFAKDVMRAADVPTARSELIGTPAHLDAALHRFGPPWVVKDDGLAAGKGVVVTTDYDLARAHAMHLLDGGHPVLVESFLDGPEASLFCVVDGTTVVPLLLAQDFKRVGDKEAGPNTGGMGSYSPLPWAPEGLTDDVVARIVQPVVDELAERGSPFSGVLYAGLALTSDGPQVIEFNCRFGDPETQSVLALLRSPLAGLLLAAAEGRLAEHPPLEWDPGAAVTVVIAAEGYPGRPRTGDVITGADAEGVLHAGTRRRDDGAIVSSGGRVLSVVGLGDDLATARDAAYRRVASVHLTGSHHRTDIALHAVRGGEADTLEDLGYFAYQTGESSHARAPYDDPQRREAEVAHTLDQLAALERTSVDNERGNLEEITVYTSNDDGEALRDAVVDILETAGYEVVARDAPERGSWFQRLFVRQKDSQAEETLSQMLTAAVDNRLTASKVGAAVQARTIRDISLHLDAPQPAHDELAANVVARLLEACKPHDEVVICTSAILLIKTAGRIACWEPTSEEIHILKANPRLMRSPQDLIDALSAAGGPSTVGSLLPEVDG